STTYTNLDPGTYTFRVKGSNNELLWGDTDTMTVIIQSPWYASIWCRVTAGVLLVLVGTCTFASKNYQQKKMNLKLSAMVSARTEERRQATMELTLSQDTTQHHHVFITFQMHDLYHREKNSLHLVTSRIDIQSFEIEH